MHTYMHMALRATTVLFLVLALAALAWGQGGPEAEASSHSATRTFGASWVAPGGELTVTVTVMEYGGLGVLTETLPEGFVYRESDVARVRTEGRDVSFPLFGVETVSYTVTAPRTAGEHAFSGILRNVDREDQAVGGSSVIRVGPPPTPAPTATPEPTATSVPTPTPTSTATPTPRPTLTPTPEPTATSTATSTPLPSPTATVTATATAVSSTGGARPPAAADDAFSVLSELWPIAAGTILGLLLVLAAYIRTRTRPRARRR